MVRNNHFRGFTIIELLIVIVVIGILAAITIVAFNGIQSRAKFNKINSELVSMRKLIAMHKAETGTYPNTGGSWRYQRIDGDSFIPGVVPTYANKLPKVTDTPIGGTTNDTYIYMSNATGTAYALQRLYQPSVPADEYANVPAAMQQTGYNDRYGYGDGLAGY